MEQYRAFEAYFDSEYKREEYPTLAIQREEWCVQRPLEGLTVLDVTPLCRNSIYKYMNLIYAGARLSIGYNPLSNSSDELLDLIKGAGIELIDSSDTAREFDIIMDCAALFIDTRARIGRVELTRSGAELYEERGERVFMADGGRIKFIETTIGTGESYFRAMDLLGYNDWRGRRLALFGCGKVGQGILRAAVSRGVEVVVISDLTVLPADAQKLACQVIDYRDTEAATAATLSCYAMTTATGQYGAIERVIDSEKLIQSELILSNMGAEDEFGESFPSSRVLAEKGGLNFLLDNPTELKYIDATMALHNYGAEYILNNSMESGVILPPPPIESELIRQSIEHGVIAQQLNDLYTGEK